MINKIKQLLNPSKTKEIKVSANKEDDRYLVIGVEDGWIHVDKKVWKQYLKAKERLKKDEYYD